MKLTAKIIARDQKIKELTNILNTVGDKAITSKVAKKIGDEITSEMKNLISKGLSPITGKRFPGYKDPKKYPGDKKGARPVNLKLSGAFLNDLTSRETKAGQGFATTIEYSSQLSKQKEQGHREGANGQLERPTIPDRQLGEGFTQKISQKIIDNYLDAADKYIQAIIQRLSK